MVARPVWPAVRRVGWRLYLSAYVAALVPYQFVPFGPAADVYFQVLAWSGVLAMAGRLLRDRPQHPAGLWWLTACETLTATGVLVAMVWDKPAPGPQDILYMAGNLAGIVGMITVAWRRTRGQGHGREGLLDAAVVSCGFALLSWVYLVRPVTATGTGLAASVVAVSYPVMDLFVLTLLVRLLLAGGMHNPALRLIGVAQLTFVLSDASFAFVTPTFFMSALGFHLTTSSALLVYGFFGAAGCHPAFTDITTRAATGDDEEWESRSRVPLLSGAVMTGPVLLMVQAWQYHSTVPDAAAIAFGCAAIFVLVVARLQTLLARVSSQTVLLGQQAERLHALATLDGLTGLTNRRGWEAALAAGLEHARHTGGPTTVALIDLDHFKRYNDTYGHQAGDRLLKSAAAAWAGQLRRGDLLARYGGEEFVALLPACGAHEAGEVVQRMRGVTPDGQTFSAGIATWTTHESGEQLVARADTALYRAKAAGRDRWSIAPQPDPHLDGSQEPPATFLTDPTGSVTTG